MMDKLFKRLMNRKDNEKKGIELQPYYMELVEKVSLEEGISTRTILEEGLKLYCQKKNISTVKLSEQEERFNNFRRDLENYLLDNLNEDSPVYKETAYWCSCIQDRKLSDKALDFQLRRIVEEIYKKPRAASIKFIANLNIDRREIQTIVINFLERF